MMRHRAPARDGEHSCGNHQRNFQSHAFPLVGSFSCFERQDSTRVGEKYQTTSSIRPTDKNLHYRPECEKGASAVERKGSSQFAIVPEHRTMLKERPR